MSGDILDGRSVVEMIAGGLELVGGMHLFAQGGFDKAEVRRVVAILHLARHGEGRVDAAVFGKQLQRRQKPPAGDDSVCGLAVLAHHERLQQSVRGNRGGELLQARVRGRRPPDGVLLGDEFVQ
jgi:hypothetical protein